MIRVGCSRSTVRYTLGPVGSTLTNGFGTRKRRTPRRVLLPESGSTEIAARIGEGVAPSCAHAVIVHSAVAITASGRRTMYFLIFALIAEAASESRPDRARVRYSMNLLRQPCIACQQM